MSSRPKTTRSTKAAPGKLKPDTDALATQLAGLSIAKGKSKTKAAVEPTLELTDGQKVAAAMREVNSSSQSLSALVQSGWKKSTDASARSQRASEIKALTATATKNLSVLRQLHSVVLDVERAAISLIGKLVSLEMFELAMGELERSHQRLSLELDHSYLPPAIHSTKVHLLYIPLPQEPSESTTLLNLVSIYLINSLIILSNTTLNPPTTTARKASSKATLSPIVLFAETLFTQPTLIQWLPYLGSLPREHLDSVSSRAYSILSKATSAYSSSVSSDADTEHLFRVRMYALLCIEHTTTMTNVDSFWDQGLKYATMYVRTATPERQTHVAKGVVEMFGRVMDIAENRPDKARFLDGRGFLSFCDYWMSLANKVEDMKMLDNIVRLMQGTSSSSNLAAQERSTPASKRSSVHATELYASMSKILLLLGNSEDDAEVLEKHLTELATMLSPPEVALLFKSSEPADRTAQKLGRAIEKLRRTLVARLDANPLGGSEAERECLEHIVLVLERNINSTQSTGSSPAEIELSSALDSILVLARTKLQLNDPRTYIPSYDYLVRGVQLLRLNECTPPFSQADLIRCLSGAFHNSAAILYQAGSHGSAIGFVKEGCRIAEIALAVRQDSNDVGPSKSEAWKQLGTQLYRRWQLLAICYMKIGDRKLALEAFHSCIRTFPYAESGMTENAAKFSVSAAFAASSSLEELGGIVYKTTFLAACELLLPGESVALPEPDIQDLSILGLLLEKQYMGLECHNRKPNMVPVLMKLISNAAEAYARGQMPVRRTRVLIQALRLSYYLGPNVIAELGTVEDLVKQIDDASNGQLHHDSELGAYRPIYQVVAKLWGALHSHREGHPDRYNMVLNAAEEACAVVKTAAMPAVPNKQSPSGNKALDSPPRLTTRKMPPAPRKPTANRALAKAPAVKPRKALQPISLNTDRPSPRPMLQETTFEEIPDLLTVMGLTAQLLGLLGAVSTKIHVLEALRTLYQHCSGVASEGFVSSSMILASEYLSLGAREPASKIYEQLLPLRAGLSPVTSSLLYLRHTEYGLMALGDISGSVNSYLQAYSIAQDIVQEDKVMSSTQRLFEKVERMERAAHASRVFALIQHQRGDAAASLEGLLQSLRIWNRAYDALCQARPSSNAAQSQPLSAESDPFLPKSSELTKPEATKSNYVQRTSMDTVEWRTAEGLFHVLLLLAKSYSDRGSAREAEYFSIQAEDLAISLNIPVMQARAVTARGEIQLAMGTKKFEEASKAIADAGQNPLVGADKAVYQRVLGSYHEFQDQIEEAQQAYEDSRDALRQLDLSLRGVLSEISTTVYPDALSDVLRQYIWLLRDEEPEEYSNLLETLLELSPLSQGDDAEPFLQAKLLFYTVLKRFRSDMYLSSVTDSTISLPIGTTGSNKAFPLPAHLKELVRSLDSIEQLLWLFLSNNSAPSTQVRQAALSLGRVITLQTSLGRSSSHTPVIVANLLDLSSSVTLQREMSECINQKAFRVGDDSKWPLLENDGSHQRQTSSHSRQPADEGLFSDEDESETTPRTVHRQPTINLPELSRSQLDALPQNWTVIHINITEDKSTLFISRQRREEQPLVFCIPLKGREDQDQLSFDDSLTELDDIIKKSNETTKRAVHIKDDQAARAGWWKERAELDGRMKDLVENIEFCWLGAFKTILSPRRRSLTPDLVASFRLQFDRVFLQGLRTHDKKTKERALGHKKALSEPLIPNRITLDDSLIECFSSLSPQCRDEELEDLAYFMLDLYQFHGIQVEISEVNITQVVVDLRTVLEEHAGLMKLATRFSSDEEDREEEHIFLVLDKNVQPFPWENIPILRGRSVSRIPNVPFLLDRIVGKADQKTKKVFYFLNPSGDLVGTQGRFEPWLKEMERKAGWKGLIGNAPSEMEFAHALENNDLVLYFGHGGGEQYIRSHKIRQLSRCASVMLWGCSSGALSDMGSYDRVGTPLHYMIAGCPTLVVNLWDVTDRDIDKFCQSVLEKTGFSTASSKKAKRRDLCGAITESRDVCKLKYMTGAAPVIYGIPLSL